MLFNNKIRKYNLIKHERQKQRSRRKKFKVLLICVVSGVWVCIPQSSIF